MARTWRMVAVAAALLGGAALADEHDFWDTVLNPHAREVNALLAEGNNYYQRAQQYYDAYQLGTKNKLLDEAMVRYDKVLALVPDNMVALEADANAAFEAGEFDRAADLLARLQTASNGVMPTFEFVRRLGYSYIKLRRWEDAEQVLEGAGSEGDASASVERSQALSLLGYVYMSEGRLEDAVDAYDRAAKQSQYGSDVASLNGLAVAYDRDEQLGRATEVLEQVKQLDPSFSHLSTLAYPSPAYQQIPFSPPSDRHYWLALAYESQAKLPDAIAEWRAYADSEDAPYKARAEEHIRADEQTLAQAAPPATKGAKGKGAKAPKRRKPR